MPNRYFLDPHFTLSLTVTLLVALTSPVMTWQEACPNAPWSLTFSYGRALQSATLKVRTALLHRHSPLQLDIQAIESTMLRAVLARVPGSG